MQSTCLTLQKTRNSFRIPSCLEMNRSCFEDQRQNLTRTDPAIRGQLLGRACTLSVPIPIYCFDFSRRMSQRLFDRTRRRRRILSFLDCRSEKRDLDGATVSIWFPMMNGRLTGLSVVSVALCLEIDSSQILIIPVFIH
jgi:hypothetical protein